MRYSGMIGFAPSKNKGDDDIWSDEIEEHPYKGDIVRHSYNTQNGEKLTDDAIGKLISEPKANQKEYVRVPCEQIQWLNIRAKSFGTNCVSSSVQIIRIIVHPKP